jgi:elongation factor Ts
LVLLLLIYTKIYGYEDMTNITAAMVKELREKSGAGMMDCKKALNETNGDIEAAVDHLRKSGIVKAGKKADRTAAQGLVAAKTSSEGTSGAVIEFNAETDFVAKNEEFQQLVGNLVEGFLGSSAAFEEFKQSKEGDITNLIAKIGENMNLRRGVKLAVGQGQVVSYVHNAVSPGMGKIAVLVALESAAPTDKLQELGKQIAMHVAAARPQSLTVEELDPELVEREKAVQKETALASGKPENVVEKMIEGRIRKFYEEVVLLEQLFVIDGKTKIRDVIAEAAKSAGSEIKLAAYARFELGEGIEVEKKDFASEVAEAMSS